MCVFNELFQALMGIASNCSTIFYAESPCAWFIDWAIDVLNHPDAPLVNSASYAQAEYADPDSTNNTDFIRTNNGIYIL